MADLHISTPDPGPIRARLRILTGPAVSAPIPLAVGTTIIGRARRCAIRIADDLLEPHHLRVVIDDDGGVEVMQLAGRVPMRVGDRPRRNWSGTLDRSPQASVEVIEIASMRLVIEAIPLGLGEAPTRLVVMPTGHWSVIRPPRRAAPELPLPAEDDLWSVHRPGSVDDVGVDARSAMPSGSPGGAAMIGSAMTLVAAAVMAVLTGQMLFMVFALTAVIGTSVTWGWGRWQRRRQRRGDRRRADMVAAAGERARAIAWTAYRDAHLARYQPVDEVLAQRHSDRLWARRAVHGDAFVAVFGVSAETAAVGSVPTDGSAALTVGVDFGGAPARAIAVTGPHSSAVVRSILLQMAIHTGPADWALVQVTSEITGEMTGERHDETTGEQDGCDGHRWAQGLPQWLGVLTEASSPPRVEAIIDAARRGRRVVLLVTAEEALRARDAPIRRLIDALSQPQASAAGAGGGGGNGHRDDGCAGVTVVVDVADARAVPSLCTGVLHTGVGALGRWSEAERTERVRLCGLDEDTAAQVAAELSVLVDPEQSSAVADRLIDEIGLDDLDGVPTDVDELISIWSSNSDPVAPIGIGMDNNGPISTIRLNLATDGPHGLIAGTTGSGKSELLRTLVISLAARVSPEHLNFVLIDYKGGATFDACAGLPHTVGMVTDLDQGLASRALMSLNAELHRRELLLRSAGAVDIDDPVLSDPATASIGPLPRLVVVIDEFAALVTEVPGFIGSLVGIAQRGRSLGVHLLLATQRPAGVIDDAIRANTDLRLALRLNDRADALDVVGTAEPAGFSRTTPGRAMMRLGVDSEVVLQAATSRHQHRSGSGTCLEHLAGIIAEAATRCGFAPAHRPWLPALSSIGSDDIATVLTGIGTGRPIGILDDPRQQRYLPLDAPAETNLAVIGALGSGTSTALGAVVDRALTTHDKVVVISSDRSAVGGGEAIIASSQIERIWRVLTQWSAEIERRRRAAVTPPPWLLAIDGLVSLRRSLDSVPAGGPRELWEVLDRILAEGPAVGIRSVVVIEDEGSRVAGLVSRFAERWVMRLGDVSDAAVYGVRPTGIARADAPPGSLVVFSSGLEGRILPDQVSAGRFDTSALETVGMLEVDIAADGLVSSSRPGSLVIGRRFDDLDTAVIDDAVIDDVVIDRVAPANAMVLGPARSGRTTALVTMGRAWAVAAGAVGGTAAVACVGAALCDALHRELSGMSSVHVHAVDPDRYPPDERAQRLAGELGDWLTATESATIRLVLIDDADRLDDPTESLVRFIGECNAVRVIAAARPDVLRQSYGHWTGVLRRDRRGLVMAATADHDADLLGEPLPRRLPIPARPGLAWWVGSGPPTLIQIANGVTPMSEAGITAGLIGARAPVLT